jgi:hypothetical protein
VVATVTDLSATPGLDAAIQQAVQQGLGALLLDRDVSEVRTLEAGPVDVVRRGRRERIDVLLEGPLFALLREGGAEVGLVRVALRGGHVLTAGPLVGGRVALRVQKGVDVDVTLARLVEEGAVPAGVGEELVGAVLTGMGALVVGPARSLRQRLVIAVLREVVERMWVVSINEHAPLGALPCPLSLTSSLQARVTAAVALGADALVGLELSIADVVSLAVTSSPVPLLGSVQASSSVALQDAVSRAGGSLDAVATVVAVTALDPMGRPRLFEVHGSVGGEDADASTAPVAPTATSMAPVTSSPRASVLVDEPAPTRGGAPEPPPTWASSAPDDDPGWELSMLDTAPRAAGSFDAALARVKSRPTFTPRAPAPHPQARGGKDPFGGLTFEPPPGGAADVDEDER